ncbi:putative short chain dehydrogenase/ reductase [Mollisia scopiformis]|uniref:Putative short chain dehydrogenase/ reductase n=1 Tax=Mollisia scopiformis TaxID=149040 RepID=A0A194XMB8_MOLSC|nr:putative short chain dehydrogenase/ reductase [Mollisia scopiformis]KUJ21323.1 putative short chain dehydrogenase/ reductase [Mollisia scopiformis]
MEGKVYAITGAGSGIGRATAIRCAELKCAGLSLCDVNFQGLETTKKLLEEAKFPGKVLLFKADVSKADEVDSWISSTTSEFGRLDGAANVAGLSRRSPETNSSNIVEEDWDTTLAVKLTGTMHCMRAQLKVITRPGGSIVNVSSGAGVKGVAGMPSYCATKWGMRGLIKTAAIEFGPVGIRVNCLMPGANFDEAVKKGLVDPVKLSEGTMMKRMGTPEEIAKVMAFLMSDDASFVTGSESSICLSTLERSIRMILADVLYS